MKTPSAGNFEWDRGGHVRALVYNEDLRARAVSESMGEMATEIERKFLVIDDSWRAAAAPGVRMRQGYLSGGEAASLRVRVQGVEAFLTIRAPRWACGGATT